MSPSGLEAVFLANRDKLIRFLSARGAGAAAEDLVHDLWLKVAGRADGPIANPLSYLYRAADLLMIDRYRSQRQAELREQAWGEDSAERAPVEAERVIAARQETAMVAAVLAALGPRRETVFRRARLDGVPQRRIAAELGISISTVEADLRAASQALLALQEQLR